MPPQDITEQRTDESAANDLEAPLNHGNGRRRSSVRFDVSAMEKLDPTEPIQRRSVLRRESFIVQFTRSKGPPEIAFAMMLAAIGIGATIGVVPAVMTDRYARLNHGYDDVEDCSSYELGSPDKPEACFLGSSDAQNAAAFASLVSNVLTFFTSSVVGSLSDEYGRRGILIAGLSLSTCSPLMLVLTQLMPSMSPWWYYGFHASTGIINWMAVALSALADVLPQKFRAPGVGLLLAGFMVGFSLSPVFAFFFNRLELSFISFSMVLAGLLATYFILPETLSSEAAEAAKKRNRRPNNASSSDTDGTTSPNGQIRYWLRRILRFISRPAREMSILNRSTFFRLISTLAFFSGMVASGDQLLLVYYVEERLGFDEKDVSYMFMIIGIFGLLAQGIVLKPLNDCIGEKYVVALCFTIGAIDNTMYGLARNKATIYIAAGCAAFTSMAFPTISAMKANNVDDSEQGRIQGALYSLQALASGVGPVLLRFVYAQTKDTSPLGPGTMFIFAGSLYVVAVVVACMLPKELANSKRDDEDDDVFDIDDIDTFNMNFTGGTTTTTTTKRSDTNSGYNQFGSVSATKKIDSYGSIN